MLIIGILASVALPQYQKAVDKSRFSNLMAITKAIADANEVYYMANGQYATDFDSLAVSIPYDSLSANRTNFEWGNCVLYAQQEIQCSNLTNLKNQYIIHYLNDTMAPGGVFCTAPNQANSRFDKLCAGLGTFYNTTSCTFLGTCRVYKLNQR